MKHFPVKILFFLIGLYLFIPAFSQVGPQVGTIQVIRDEKGVLWGLGVKTIPPVAENNELNQQDGSVQRADALNGLKLIPMQATQEGANNEGIPSQSVNPADPSMAVGPNQIIQLIKA